MRMMRRWCLPATIVLMSISCLHSAPGAPTGRTPPNVVLIVVDDLRPSLGCYGDAAALTPSLDRLASEGVRFDRAYTSFPLCNPSRTCAMSGRRPETTRVFDNDTSPRTALGGVELLPEYFARHGYFTARVGKLFQARFKDEIAFDVADNVPAPRLDAPWLATDEADADEPDGMIASRTAALVDAHRDAPFLIMAGFHRPHTPYVAPRHYFDLHPASRVTLPVVPDGDLDDVPRQAISHTPLERLSDGEKRQLVAAYAACVSFVDAQIREVLDAIDRAGLRDRTVVIVVSDHGYQLGEHGLWRKKTLFEVSTRIPMIVRAPGVRPASSGRLVELVDLFPTLTELCGMPLPDGLEGTSFAPLLAEPDREWKRAAFTDVTHGRTAGHSVRTERYRYTDWGAGAEELYDHETDPSEFTNLAGDPAYAGALDDMRAILRSGWRGALPPE